MNIYRSFEQWKNGGFLEHGAPRTEEYTAEELHLVEMGWNYGYDAGRAVEQALDKKAENARELGLDYEPAVQEPVFCEYCGGNDDADFGLPTDHCTDCARPQPDYAWPTIEDYEKEVGFEVNDAFKAAWTMARTTNDLFKQMGEIK
jgi:hypothetical protein